MGKLESASRGGGALSDIVVLGGVGNNCAFLVSLVNFSGADKAHESRPLWVDRVSAFLFLSY